MHQAVQMRRALKGAKGMRCIPLSLTAVALLLFLARGARCDTIYVTDATQNTATGVFTYDVEVTDTAVLDPGDGFVIYDIPGYISSSLALTLPSGSFAASTSLLGNAITDTSSSATNVGPLVPNKVDSQADLLGGLVDDPNLINLSYIYSGPTIPKGTEYDGVLTVNALPSSGTEYTVVASKDSGGSGSNGELDVSTVTVPSVPNTGNGNPAPLPASFWGGGTLLALLAGMVVSRRKNLRVG